MKLSAVTNIIAYIVLLYYLHSLFIVYWLTCCNISSKKGKVVGTEVCQLNIPRIPMSHRDALAKSLLARD